MLRTRAISWVTAARRDFDDFPMAPDVFAGTP